jgi:hypothetical protein
VLVVGAALVAGLVVGSALAPLPYSGNDECLLPADAHVADGAEAPSTPRRSISGR